MILSEKQAAFFSGMLDKHVGRGVSSSTPDAFDRSAVLRPNNMSFNCMCMPSGLLSWLQGVSMVSPDAHLGLQTRGYARGNQVVYLRLPASDALQTRHALCRLEAQEWKVAI